MPSEKELDLRERLLREREVELRLREMATNLHTTDAAFHQTVKQLPETLGEKSDSSWKAVCSWCGSAGCSENSFSVGWVYYY
jgi:hypothetical protein